MQSTVISYPFKDTDFLPPLPSIVRLTKSAQKCRWYLGFVSVGNVLYDHFRAILVTRNKR